MKSRYGHDLTTGSTLKNLLTLAVPMLMGNLLHTGYSIINTIWIGQTIGKEAIGAAAVTFPIIFVLIGLASGATMATSILVSQYYGAKNDAMVKRIVATSFTIAIILGATLSLLGFLGGDFMLKLMNTPPTIFAYASSYLKISSLSFLCMFLSFFTSSVLRGIGDTKTPLIFMSVGLGLNAILDPLLIMGIGPFPRWELNGAAVASLISSTVSLLFCLYYIHKKAHLISFSPRKLKIEWELVPVIFKIGFPSMLQQSIASFSGVFLTSLVNHFGPEAIAAFGATSRVEAVVFMPIMSFGMAASTLTGQNIGANKIEKVHEIFKYGSLVSCGLTLFLSLILFCFPLPILSLFVKDSETISIGISYFRYVGSFYFVVAIMFVSNGIINGAGHTFKTMLFTLIALWFVRVPVAYLLSQTANLGIHGIWLGIIAGPIVGCSISLIYYRAGAWKKKISTIQTPIVPSVQPET